MSLFKKKLTVNQAINAAHTTENSVLIDCREKKAFQQGHVPGAISIPTNTFKAESFQRRFADTNTAFYVIGSYSEKPQDLMKLIKKAGYKDITYGGVMEEHHGILKKG